MSIDRLANKENLEKIKSSLDSDVINPLVKISFEMETSNFQGVEIKKVSGKIVEAIENVRSVKNHI